MKRQNFTLNKNRILKYKAFIEDINFERNSHLPEFIKNSEEIYHNQVTELVNDFLSCKQKKIILLAGPSSSGKTTTSAFICQKLEEHGKTAVTISLDNFYKNREDAPNLPDGSKDIESLYAYDNEYFTKFITEIVTTKKSLMPIFSFEEQMRTGFVPFELNRNEILIVEGIHALNPDLLQIHSEEAYRIYICLNTDFYFKNKLILPSKTLRFMRRCTRDFYYRGTSISALLSMWPKTIQSEEVFIKPYKEDADYIVDSTIMYEPLVFAKYLKPLIENKNVDTDNIHIKEVLKAIAALQTIPKEAVPKSSLLWEFLPTEERNT